MLRITHTPKRLAATCAKFLRLIPAVIELNAQLDAEQLISRASLTCEFSVLMSNPVRFFVHP